jgi:hypothetical protein
MWLVVVVETVKPSHGWQFCGGRAKTKGKQRRRVIESAQYRGVEVVIRDFASA